MVTITADVDGRPLSELSRLINLRSKWLGESARDSVRATAVTFLQSLRTLTKTAKRNGEKIELTHLTCSSLHSVDGEGKAVHASV